jgi:putative FmdB family regulatory protein
MPIFEYVCDECQTRYERLVMNGNSNGVSCPKCGSERNTLQFSTFSAGKSDGDSRPAASSAPSCCGPRGCGCH